MRAQGVEETVIITIMEIPEIEEKLSAAQERLNEAHKVIAKRWQPDTLKDLDSAEAEVLTLERELASAKGEEYAVPLNFPVQWEPGAPSPHLIASEYQTFLIFDVRVANRAGTYMRVDGTMLDREDGSPDSVALVEFKGCASVKMGSPNEEVFGGHPLSGRGLDEYSAQLIQNSKWIAELEAINKVHQYYQAERWRTLKHYVFWFHDSTFECVAESHEVEVYQETMADLLSRACRRLLS